MDGWTDAQTLENLLGPGGDVSMPDLALGDGCLGRFSHAPPSVKRRTTGNYRGITEWRDQMTD